MFIKNYLYRIYGKNGELLYVGISIHPKIRFKQHAASKPWWKDVSYAEVEEVGSRQQAENAETFAIQTELPVHNVAKQPVMIPVTPTAIQDIVGGVIFERSLESIGKKLKRKKNEAYHIEARPNHPPRYLSDPQVQYSREDTPTY